jgi:lipopolysaccharide exporter
MGKAVRSAAWTILTGIGARALGLVGTLWLTYYLGPDVQGEVWDAFILVMTAHQLSTLGATQYLVAYPKSGPEVAWHVTVFQLVLGLVSFAIVFALRKPLGALLNAPSVDAFLPGLVLAVFLDRCGMVPERLLVRQLMFRAIGIGRTVGEIAYTLSSVGLAMAGFGGMAMVYGNILRSALTLLVFAGAVSWRDWLVPRRFSLATMRPVLRYGVPLWVGGFATFASRRWDNLIVSSLFDASVVGWYNQAYNLADLPATQVGEQIGDVLFPSFAQMEPEDRKRALVRATGLLALIVFPLAVGLGAVATTLVRALLAPTWQNVGPMLVVLSALSVVRPVGWTIQAYLQASHRPAQAMWLGLAKVAFLVASLLVLGHLTKNALWTCGAVGLAFGLHSLASMFVVRMDDGIRVSALLGRCIPPLLATAPMALAVFGARYGLAHVGVTNARVGLVVELVAGGAVYVASALVVAREVSLDFLNLVKNAIKRRRGGDRTSSPPDGPVSSPA